MSDNKNGLDFGFDDDLLSSLNKLKLKYSTFDELEMDVQTNQPQTKPETVKYEVETDSQAPELIKAAEKYEIDQSIIKEPETPSEYHFSDSAVAGSERPAPDSSYYFSKENESESEKPSDFSFSDDLIKEKEPEADSRFAFAPAQKPEIKEEKDTFVFTNPQETAPVEYQRETAVQAETRVTPEPEAVTAAEEAKAPDFPDYEEIAEINEPEEPETEIVEYEIEDTPTAAYDFQPKAKPLYDEPASAAQDASADDADFDADDDDFADLDEDDESNGKKSKKKKSGHKLSNKALITILCVAIPIAIWTMMFVTDLILVNKWYSPFFCVETAQYENGGRNYTGVFYKVQFSVDSNGEATGEIIPWGVKGPND